jgi:actin
LKVHTDHQFSLDDDLTAFLVDNGSGLDKAWFAGYDAPGPSSPPFWGCPRHHGVTVDKRQKDTFMGAEAQSKRGILILKYPIDHDIVTNWFNMEKIWHQTFYNKLHVVLEGNTVLLTMPPRVLRPTLKRWHTSCLRLIKPQPCK